MKIGIVCYPTYGGSGVVATELGNAFARKGHQVHFISYSQPVRLEAHGNNIFFHEVGILNYPLFDYPPYELALISKLVDVISFEKLDILHVHYAIPHAFAACMAKQMLKNQGYFIPVITTLHGTDITLVGKDPSYETAVTFSINHSDAVTAVSEFLKKESYSHFNIQNEIEVIPNFINIENFRHIKKDYFKKAIAPEDEKIITHISNFRQVKRVEDVVKTFLKIREKEPAKLMMVGDGPERSNAEKLCRESAYCNDIRFLGKIDAVEEILSISDLFLLTSETESFGLAALEAMASKVPVVSTHVGGLTELNLNGYSGYTCPVGDIEQMTQRSLSIISDQNTLKKFKDQAYKRALDFDISKVMPRYEELYENLLLKISH